MCLEKCLIPKFSFYSVGCVLHVHIIQGGPKYLCFNTLHISFNFFPMHKLIIYVACHRIVMYIFS